MAQKRAQKSNDCDLVEYSQSQPSKSKYAPTLGPHPPFEPLQIQDENRLGKAVNVPTSYLSPIDIFRLLFDDTVVSMLIKATNHNAQRKRNERKQQLEPDQKQRNWTDITSDEMLCFLGKF